MEDPNNAAACFEDTDLIVAYVIPERKADVGGNFSPSISSRTILESVPSRTNLDNEGSPEDLRQQWAAPLVPQACCVVPCVAGKLCCFWN